jgi:hypothetical protein
LVMNPHSSQSLAPLEPFDNRFFIIKVSLGSLKPSELA